MLELQSVNEERGTLIICRNVIWELCQGESCCHEEPGNGHGFLVWRSHEGKAFISISSGAMKVRPIVFLVQ